MATTPPPTPPPTAAVLIAELDKGAGGGGGIGGVSRAPISVTSMPKNSEAVVSSAKTVATFGQGFVDAGARSECNGGFNVHTSARNQEGHVIRRRVSRHGRRKVLLEGVLHFFGLVILHGARRDDVE